MTIFDKNAFDLVVILLVTFWFLPFGAFMALLQRLRPAWFKRKPGESTSSWHDWIGKDQHDDRD